MKLRKKFNKVTAWILTCILFFTMAFSITSEAYGEGYTHAKQFKNCHIYNGIDVSTWNKQIDWNAVKASGIDFAFIKVGGRGWGSAGTLYHDSRALENLKGAKAAGIKIGVYFFSQAITEKEAAEEAQYTINYLHTYGISIDLPIAMDFEYASDSPTGGRLRTANLTREQATNVCLAFCSYVATRGYTPMVYANKSMLTNDMNASTIASRYPIWLAQYNSSATYTGAYSYWQYTSSGTVPGIEGRVDMNFYYSTDGSFSSKINIPVPTGETAPADAKIVYATHIQTYGWEKEETYDGGISGTVGQAKRLEAIKIRNNTGIEGSVEYQVHCQSFGWMDWTMDGDIAGLTGLAKRLEAIRIRLTGQLAEQYDVYYRVQCQTYGWLDWAKNGQTAGSTNYAKRLEAIQIKLVPKNSDTSQFEDGKKAYIKGTPTANYSTQAQEVLAQCNAQRQANGIAALSLDPELTKAANIRAQEIATLFSHTRPDGRKCFTVLDQIGYSYWSAGENIAAGYGNSSAVMNGWMNSPGHRSNILNAGFKRLGVGYVYIPNSEYGYYWVQIFSN